MWSYEIRDLQGRLVESKGGYPSQKEALDAGAIVRDAIQTPSARFAVSARKREEIENPT
jgi:hypothetical protein